MKKSDKKKGWIRLIYPEIVQSSLKDNIADADRLLNGIQKALGTENVVMDLSLVRRLPARIRELKYNMSAAVYHDRNAWHLIDLFPAEQPQEQPPEQAQELNGPLFGIAVDLGSSTIVVQLIDIKGGKVRDESSFLNPQLEIGSDILTRIHFSAEPGGLKKLHELLLDRLNKEIHNLSEKNGINSLSIIGMTLSGNTTMTHFFLGLDPRWICREPYIPVVNKPAIQKAAELELEINPLAPILILPNVGSYFGGDLIAGIIASGMSQNQEISILVDVGTNAEVVLGNIDRLMACAGAAGPALEGGVADIGMMAGPGVIDSVVIETGSGDFHIRTIDGSPPVGICGSGMIDLVAQLFKAGMIDMRGKFVPDKCGNRLSVKDETKHLVIIPSSESGSGEELTLSQTDIDALIRSKAAMYTILTTITQMVNISLEDIVNFYIAGTFGTYIDPLSAITIGMIPDIPLERYKPLGNSSLKGAGWLYFPRLSGSRFMRSGNVSLTLSLMLTRNS